MVRLQVPARPSRGYGPSAEQVTDLQSPLAVTAGDIVLRLLLGGVAEDLRGVTVLDEVPLVQVHGPVRDPAHLREVVG